MMEDETLGEDLPLSRSRLFERLSQIPHYTWDQSYPPAHSTYDHWHVVGILHNHEGETSLTGSSVAYTTRSSGSTRSSPKLAPRPNIRQHWSSISGASTESELSTSRADPEQIWTPVVARISTHTLRLEREYNYFRKVIKDYDPNHEHSPRPLELFRLPATPGDSESMIVCIYEAPGPNYLQDFLYAVEPAHHEGKQHRNSIDRTPSDQIPLQSFLDFAVGACETLELMHHGSNEIHGEIRQDTFHWNRENNRVTLGCRGNGRRTFDNLLSSEGWAVLNKEADIKNKLSFIAPEQTGRLSVDPDNRTDIYSLGILFWTILVGREPFDADTPIDVIQKVLTAGLSPVSSHRIDVPNALSHMISKMTQKQMDERYNSINGLKNDLTQIQRLLGEGDQKRLDQFVIAQKDVSSVFILPSKLFGRHHEMEKIIKVVEKVHKRNTSGARKVGQQSVVNGSASSVSDNGGLNLDIIDGSESSSSVGYRDSRSNSTAIMHEAPLMGFKSGSYVGRNFTDPRSASIDQSLSDKDSAFSGHLPTSNGDGLGPIGRRRNSHKFKKRGRAEMIILTGGHGVGKSALLKSTHQHVRRHGYIASTAFDKARPSPYERLLKVMGSLFRQIFSDKDVSTPYHEMVRSHARPIWASLHQLLGLPESLLDPALPSRKMLAANDIRAASLKAENSQQEPKTTNGTTSHSMWDANDFLRGPASTKTIRLMSTFIDLLRVMTTGKLICISLDNLHAAEDESIDLTFSILKARIPVLLLAASRPEDSEDVPERLKPLFNHDSVTIIELANLREKCTFEYVAATLSRTVEHIVPLAAMIHEKSRGNPFLVKEILQTCYGRNCLWYDWKSSSWQYNLDKIFDDLSTEGTMDNTYLTRKLSEMPVASRSILAWASVIGETFSYKFISKLLSGEFFFHSDGDIDSKGRDVACSIRAKQLNLSEADCCDGLQQLLLLGVLVPGDNDDEYRFSHARYLNAANEMGECANEAKMHYVLARAMMCEMVETKEAIYAHARHICLASDIIRERLPHRVRARDRLWKGAQAAVESGANATALWYYRTCLKLMQDDRWDTDHPDVFYDETLQVCINLAELHVHAHDFDAALELVNETFEHAKCPADKTRSYLLKGKILASQGRFSEAFTELTTSLATLGVPMKQATWDECDIEFKKLEYRLRNMDRSELLAQELSEDKDVIAIGTVLGEALGAVYWSNSLLWYQLVIAYVNAILDRGMFIQAGFGFNFLAVAAIGRFKDAELALMYVETSHQLFARFEDTFTRGRGWTLYAVFLSHLQIPVRNTLQILDNALEFSLNAGENVISILNIGAMATYRFFAGQDLADIEAFCTYAPEEFDDWRTDVRGGTFLIAIRQLCRALQGKTNVQSAETILDDETHSTKAWMEMSLRNILDSTRSRDIYNAITCPAYFIYGYHEHLIKLGREMMSTTLDDMWTLRPAAQVRFYTALSLLQVAKTKPLGAERDALVAEAREAKQFVDSWSAINDVNYNHWSQIIAAEIGEVTEDCEAAIMSSEMATDHCAVHGFALEEAISLELQAESLISWGGKRAAKAMIQEAIAAWNRINATGKAKQLSDKHEWLLKTAVTSRTMDASVQTNEISALVNTADPGLHTQRDYTKSWIEPKAATPINATSDVPGLGLDILDLTSILEFSRVLSSELQINALLSKMTGVILECVGGQAEFCAVIIDSEDNGWSVAASGDSENGVKTYPEGIPFADVDDQVAQHITNYILRTKETVFLSNVLDDERFANVSDAYLQRNPSGRSIICIPIVQADHLMGIIHLEGRPHAFTQRNMVVLNLITTQVSISLGNALLYRKVRKVSAANAAMVESQKRALAAAREAEAKAKKAEAEAKHNVKLKEEAAKAKSIFLANVSHELRTPLNGVIGMSELLKGTPLSKDQEGYADSIRVCADTLLTVINDILDFSKLEAGKMQMFTVPLNLKETITEVVRALVYTNQEKGVKTIEELNLDDYLVLGDPVRLHQIFMNLLSNAYKFTPKGSVTIRAEKVAESKDKIKVKCSVADTGIGITQEQLTRLFQPFSQADSSTARSYGGSGLGLSICKAMIENVLGGKIWIESTPSVGTTVYFTLTFPKAPKDISAPQEMRISAKDPDPMANWSQAASPEHENQNFSSTDLSKIPRSELRVCIAEDNQINRRIAISFVQKIGLQPEAYEDGKQAYEALQRRSKEGNPFHIVLMDVQMPVLDGYEATKAIRADPDPNVCGVLVIAMTASAIRGDREKCLEAGMNDYLAKPVRQTALKAMLDEYINNTKSASMAVRLGPDHIITPGDKVNGVSDKVEEALKESNSPNGNESNGNGKMVTSPTPIETPKGIRPGPRSLSKQINDNRNPVNGTAVPTLQMKVQPASRPSSPPSGKRMSDEQGHLSHE